MSQFIMFGAREAAHESVKPPVLKNGTQLSRFQKIILWLIGVR